MIPAGSRPVPWGATVTDLGACAFDAFVVEFEERASTTVKASDDLRTHHCPILADSVALLDSTRDGLQTLDAAAVASPGFEVGAYRIIEVGAAIRARVEQIRSGLGKTGDRLSR